MDTATRDEMDARLDNSAKALLECDPKLQELARTDWPGAFRQALQRAAVVIGYRR